MRLAEIVIAAAGLPDRIKAAKTLRDLSEIRAERIRMLGELQHVEHRHAAAAITAAFVLGEALVEITEKSREFSK